MGQDATLGEFLIGVEGLALLRLAFTDEAEERAARVAEVRDLVVRLDADADLAAGMAGAEHDVDDGYRLWSASYDAPLRLFAIEEPPVHRRIDSFAPGIVLDAACGTGRHGARLAAAGHDVIGVDASESMLELARGKVPTAAFHRGDLADLPVDDAAADSAVCGLALVHVGDLGPVFAEFARVVRPGGRIVVSDVHPFLVSLGWQAQFPAGDGGAGFMRLHHHLLSDYLAAASRGGLVLVGCEEPLLTADGARTAAADRAPDANRQAFVGLPAVVVWEFARP